MARLVEDSDDDFPEIAEIVNRKVAPGPALSRSRRRKTMQAARKDDYSEAYQKNEEISGSRVERSGSIARRKDDEVMKARPKKRILNQTSDNPLLRPLTGSVSSKESSGVFKWVTKIEPRRQKLSRKTVQNVDSEDVSQPSFVVQDLEEKFEFEKKEELPKKAERKEKIRVPVRKAVDLDSDSEEYEGASGLSDFIVDDSIILEEEEEESIVESPPPPPRSVRRLVQGRRRRIELEDSDSEDLEIRMGKLNVEDDVFQASKKKSNELEKFVDEYGETELPSSIATKKPGNGTRANPIKTSKTVQQDMLTSDVEDPFTLSYSPSERKPKKMSKEARFATPPRSPELQPKKLQSPKKQFPRIPSTPHRQSMDTFWQQDVVNEWNDEYSPQKTLFPKPKIPEELSPQKSPKRSPTKQDRLAKEAKKAFSESKHTLAESFLTELDTTITNGEIVRLAASTGGVKIIWSKKLNTTAGRANWKRETIKSSSSAPTGTTIYRHHAAIELAEKVIDDEHRLLNVIAHEFCHLANFMVSGIKTNPHGKEFKVWAAKCSRHFGDRGIEVTTKHSYEIDYKYVWSCTNERCGVLFKRHSKSVDPKRHQCGSCKSRLVQIKPVPRVDATGGTKISEYQMFVKENMKRVREENPGSPQKDIMGLVGKEYQLHKASKLGDGLKALESVSVDEVFDSKEGTPDDGVGDVVRKLDFLDLTSP